MGLKNTILKLDISISKLRWEMIVAWLEFTASVCKLYWKFFTLTLCVHCWLSSRVYRQNTTKYYKVGILATKPRCSKRSRTCAREQTPICTASQEQPSNVLFDGWLSFLVNDLFGELERSKVCDFIRCQNEWPCCTSYKSITVLVLTQDTNPIDRVDVDVMTHARIWTAIGYISF